MVYPDGDLDPCSIQSGLDPCMEPSGVGLDPETIQSTMSLSSAQAYNAYIGQRLATART